MSGDMVTSDFPDFSHDISKNLKIFTKQAFMEWPDEWTEISKPEKVDLQINKRIRYEGGGQAGQIDQGQSARQKKIYQGHKQTSLQKDYGVELPVTYQQRRYVVKNANFMQQLAHFNARSMKLVKENDAANTLNNGFSGSYVGGDAVALYSASHTFKSDTTTYDNLLSAVDLGRDAMEDALIKAAETKKESNIPQKIVVKKIHYSTQNIFTVPELLVTVKDPESANNTHNVIRDFNIQRNLNHFISGSDDYFLDSQINTRTLQISLPTTFDQYMEKSTKSLIERGWTGQATIFHDQAGTFGSQGG